VEEQPEWQRNAKARGDHPPRGGSVTAQALFQNRRRNMLEWAVDQRVRMHCADAANILSLFAK